MTTQLIFNTVTTRIKHKREVIGRRQKNNKRLPRTSTATMIIESSQGIFWDLHIHADPTTPD